MKAAPKSLQKGGRALWRAITSDFDLAQHELAILSEACRTVDTCDALDALIRAEGVTVSSPQGVKAHPATVEARQQRIALARLLTALRIPLDEDQAAGRAPRRGGLRGVYGMGGDE